MPREFRHLVMTKHRRIAHPPREAQCIARLLLMQVIFVCVAHAAQRAWMKQRAAGGDPGVDVMHEGIPATEASEIIAFEEDPADAPVIPLRTLWESFTDMDESRFGYPCRSFVPGRLRPAKQAARLTAGYRCVPHGLSGCVVSSGQHWLKIAPVDRIPESGGSAGFAGVRELWKAEEHIQREERKSEN